MTPAPMPSISPRYLRQGISAGQRNSHHRGRCDGDGSTPSPAAVVAVATAASAGRGGPAALLLAAAAWPMLPRPHTAHRPRQACHFCSAAVVCAPGSSKAWLAIALEPWTRKAPPAWSAGAAAATSRERCIYCDVSARPRARARRRAATQTQQGTSVTSDQDRSPSECMVERARRLPVWRWSPRRPRPSRRPCPSPHGPRARSGPS